MVRYDIRAGVKKLKTKTSLTVSAIALGVTGLGVAVAIPVITHADSNSIDFESYSTAANIDGQDGWSSKGAAGSGCAVYDHHFSGSLGTTGFGNQSLRISNAVTSGCFSDQTFSKSLSDEAGETSAVNDGLSGGTRQPHFESQFSLASTVPGAPQPGLAMSVSPDRGDGARMSYLRFEDQSDGIHVFFDDYQDMAPFGTSVGDINGCSGTDNFVETDIATLSRATPHTVKFDINFVDGPRNDVVKIYIDGTVKATGTSWEDYFRYCEGNPTRPVDSLLFRTGGTAAPGTAGNGFLVDNLSLLSGPIPPAPTVKVTIDKFVDGAQATAANTNSASFPMASSWNATNLGGPGSGTYALAPIGFNNPIPYFATTSDMSQGADYATNEVTGGPVVATTCTPGTPYALVGYSTGSTLAAAQSATVTTASPAFTNLQGDQFVIVWNKSCAKPTNADQCKNNGWKTYGIFKNQGDCVSFVATGGKNQPSGH